MFYDKTVLDNGMTVITERMDTVRSVALGIWFAVGSRDETPAEAGMSHFIEHMMFKGTPTRTAAEISRGVRPARRRAQRVHQQGVHVLLRARARPARADRRRDPRRTWS